MLTNIAHFISQPKQVVGPKDINASVQMKLPIISPGTNFSPVHNKVRSKIEKEILPLHKTYY